MFLIPYIAAVATFLYVFILGRTASQLWTVYWVYFNQIMFPSRSISTRVTRCSKLKLNGAQWYRGLCVYSVQLSKYGIQSSLHDLWLTAALHRREMRRRLHLGQSVLFPLMHIELFGCVVWRRYADRCCCLHTVVSSFLLIIWVCEVLLVESFTLQSLWYVGICNLVARHRCIATFSGIFI